MRLLNLHILVTIIVSLETIRSSESCAGCIENAQRINLNTSGFISIDCGNTEDSSQDPFTGIIFSSDAPYINTGVNYKIAPEYLNDPAFPQLYKNVRSFPDSFGDRNCYTIPITKGSNYLIRARFMYGNYDGKNTTPSFDVYIGVNFWVQVELHSNVDRLFPELMHKPTMDTVYICLVNIGQGAPFISAIELRPLPDSIYNHTGPLETLSRLWRFDVGTDKSHLNTSFVDDPYNRVWEWAWLALFPNSENFTVNTALPYGAYEIPQIVLQTALKPSANQSSLIFIWDQKDTWSQVYVYWHFAELEKLVSGDSRQFNIFVNGYPQIGPITLDYAKPVTVVSPEISLNGLPISFSINQTSSSTLPPILNALEIYNVLQLPQSATNEEDANAIMDVKRMCNVERIWQGDPCLPTYPWDGLNCSFDGNNPPRITDLNLASSCLTGVIPTSLSNLTSLTYLNLSNNGFTGEFPEFLVGMTSLQIIDLSDNNLSGRVPLALLQRANNGSLTLRLANNPDLCVTDHCGRKINYKLVIPLVLLSSLFVIGLIVLSTFCSWKLNRIGGRGGVVRIERSISSNKRQFTELEVINMTRNFQTMIGKGGFGTVYRGSLEDGTQVAVKVLNELSAIGRKLFQTEVRLLVRVHHKYLVSLVGYCDQGATMALIYEYMANGNLQEHLSERRSDVLSWKKRLQIAIQTAQGLEYLHYGCKPPIIHRDLKACNILLDSKLQAKIGDFGLSRILSNESQSHVSTKVAGTYGYMDPEYYKSHKLNEKIDVYGFGVVLLELITGRPAVAKGDEAVHLVEWVRPNVEGGNINDIIDMRLQGSWSINSAWKALEIAMGCVPSSAAVRPTMSQVAVDLKECLDIQLADERDNKMRSPMPPDMIFDMAAVDTELAMGPEAR
ncbi:hypothetical protein Droror1_Dr00009874 [Drosera rotundifolia]